MDEARHSQSVLWDKLEGWGGEGGERGVQDGRDKCMLMASSYRCKAEAIIIL